MGRYDAVMGRTEWFRHDRFGMFIHYGLYSVAARHEWLKSRECTKEEDYQKYFDHFTAENYDPREWAKIAKNAGMKYAILTTKHHEGFCLFDSAYTEYKATNTPAGRDLVREFVDAFRAEGLKVGFYYSLIDWHHPDYPHKNDRFHPRRLDADVSDDHRDFSRYVDYLHNQVRELMTNYGKIDIAWFDFSYGEMTGEKWKAGKLVKMIRELQPDIILDNRLVKDSGWVNNADRAEDYNGDFACPEEFSPDKAITDELGRPYPWELCLTTQGELSWGYVANNVGFMNARDVIRTLVDCVSNDGNFLLNVGPNGKGEFPRPVVKLFEEVGEWMHANGESIYGCGSAPVPRPAWGRYTMRDNTIYAHFFDKLGYMFELQGMSDKDVGALLRLNDNSEVKIKSRYLPRVVVNLSYAQLPDQNDTVIKVCQKK